MATFRNVDSWTVVKSSVFPARARVVRRGFARTAGFRGAIAESLEGTKGGRPSSMLVKVTARGRKV